MNGCFDLGPLKAFIYKGEICFLRYYKFTEEFRSYEDEDDNPLVYSSFHLEIVKARLGYGVEFGYGGILRDLSRAPVSAKVAKYIISNNISRGLMTKEEILEEIGESIYSEDINFFKALASFNLYGQEFLDGWLSAAVARNNLRLAKYLISLGADPGFENERDTCGSHAIRYGYLNILRYLIGLGIKIPPEMPYEHAEESIQLNMFKYLNFYGLPKEETVEWFLEHVCLKTGSGVEKYFTLDKKGKDAVSSSFIRNLTTRDLVKRL